MSHHEEIEQLLKNLHLRAMAEMLPQALSRAAKESPSYENFLLGLLQEQWHARQQSSLDWRIGQARIPEQWSIESFPFKQQPGVQRRQIQELAGLDFISKAENIVFIGQTGVGKSGLATGLLLKALLNGYRGLFIRAQDLFDEMYSSLADRSTPRLIQHLARIPVLLVDELGYLNLRPEQSNTFFKLMEERYRRHSTIITTNLEYDDWHSFLGQKSMVDALLSRVRHQCHTIRINGPSLRKPTG
jgi:DNA replication protein DnaC